MLNLNNNYSSYNWSTGSTGSSIPVNGSGTYLVTVTNSFGCTGTDDITITEHPTPMTDMIRTICEGESVEVGGV